MERGPVTAAVRWAPAAPLVALVAACGGTAAAIPVATTHTAAPATSTAAPATDASTPAATTPTPAPAPPQPAVVVTQQVSGHTVLQVMSPDGTPLWAAPVGNQSFTVAGSRIFESDYMARRITVIDSHGNTAGGADLPGGSVVFSPSAAEWAWSTLDSTSPSPAPAGYAQPITATGSFWVAGLGEAPHAVYHWTENRPGHTGGYLFDNIVRWTDQGLVSSPNPPGEGCAENGQTVSYVVNPSTGARADLASDGRGVVDVHDGVVVAFTTAQVVALSGRTQYTWTNTPIQNDHPVGQAWVSTQGSSVMVPVINSGCGGQQPEQRTIFINVADHTVNVVSGYFGRGWLDDSHAIAEVVDGTPMPELDVIGVDGSHALLGHGNFVGVLQPA